MRLKRKHWQQAAQWHRRFYEYHFELKEVL
jgi:hypothetical protein